MKQLIIILLFAFLAIPLASVAAQEKEAGSAAILASGIPQMLVDPRVTRLSAFLEIYDSPLAEEAAHFITEADRYNVDWKLVAAIAGVESTFGKRIPIRSYNGWGWGVFTGKSYGVGFMSWKAGITEVTRGLREKYMDRGALTIEQIGRRYASSPAWASHVRFFIQKLEKFAPAKLEYLALAL